MFRDKSWKAVYRSETDNILEDFYLPALTDAASYDRAVGFFSASMLSYAAQGVSALVSSGGHMRLVFGGEIEEEDAGAIADGYDLRIMSERVGQFVLKTIDNLAEALTTQRLLALSWLVANGHLDIKLALKRRGMYHEKIGIFRDRNGDALVFQGSANETTAALLPDYNFESINVFPSWRAELAEHYQPYIDGFERLWLNETLNTHVIAFPEAAKERLIKIAARQTRAPAPNIELDLWRRLTEKKSERNPDGEAIPKVPTTYKGTEFRLAPHQRDALNAWKSRDFRGILSMATGSGKTVTAIYGAVKLFEKTRRLFVIVAVPYQALGDQWVEELSTFGIMAIPCYQSIEKWAERLSLAATQFQNGSHQFVACVVVNRTLTSEAFQQRLQRVPGDGLLLIGDECHHHAAAALSAALPKHARFRLGLSATPRHYFDNARTETLFSYYGEISYEYSLERALEEGVLTPYRYHVHLVELTEDETEIYLEVSARIARLAAGADLEDSESLGSTELKMLLFRRARLLGNAANKLDLLEALLDKTQPAPFHLFYCGDGADDEQLDESLSRQVDRVSRMLYERRWKVSHFTSRETSSARQNILDNFRVGMLDGLVAIRCLDEGVDVPDCRVAYILASSRNPKQFIQRRGRILRRAPNKERAIVHDFVVILPDESVSGSSAPLRKLLIGELMRVSEFGRLAENRSDVYGSLKPLLEKYDLHHYFS
jgi:superfamily II DNA or RNA helicase